MLGRLAAIGLSYYHQRALCWNNEILHTNMFSWPFFHSIVIQNFIFKMSCKNDKLKWNCAVLIWFASYWAPNHMSIYSETCKLHCNQIRVWCHQVITSLFHISNAVFKISAGPRTLTGKIWVGPASFPSLSYINIYKFWQNCALVRQVSDLILKTANGSAHILPDHTPDRSCLGFPALDGETVYQATESKHVLCWTS